MTGQRRRERAQEQSRQAAHSSVISRSEPATKEQERRRDGLLDAGMASPCPAADRAPVVREDGGLGQCGTVPQAAGWGASLLRLGHDKAD